MCSLELLVVPMSNTTPAIIQALVETFERYLSEYQSTKNETELRREFLDKFLAALGWDVANEKGSDEFGKEVLHEFSVDVAGQQKKADYAFRAGRGNKFDFLVEAKKPSVKVETSQEAAFQIRRYGWSAKLPINILTDFEHSAVYDCRTKPSINDKASMGRILLIHYKEYVERWSEIAALFAPAAVRQGSIAKYAEGASRKKGTADVDTAFLQEIERWRELLARNIALRNAAIDIAGLNYAVQMTIDRIVFLRICEERGIEPENQLLEAGNRDGVYAGLCQLFKRADTKYNSGLFHFKDEKEVVSRPDDLTPSLAIDDKVLKDIISNLYYPKSPYAFLYIPSDILGQVYERFLGKVIRLTAGHQAKVEEKPEVRKAGGVYYTPTYIVEYIVKNTVGKLVEKKSPQQVAALKIVDPACGSGTFLLGAYQFLLDWHLNWYTASENEPGLAEKHKAIVKVGEGYRLTTAKKKEILVNNIFGVDIDAQAVEVTKLSLLLKVLENASGQLELVMERVLPDLGNNIKCGNSLVGFDYFEGQLLPDEDERARVNPFDWRSEFKEVFSHNGFDAVIGNPPYVRQEVLGENFKLYAQGHFKTFSSTADLYTYFIERSHSILRTGGKFGMICSNKFMRSNYGKALRGFIASNSQIAQIVDFGELRVFENAATFPAILLTTHIEPSAQEFDYAAMKRLDFFSLEEEVRSINIHLTENSIRKGEWTLLDERSFSVFEKIKNAGIPLGDYTKMEVYRGIITGCNSAFVIAKGLRDFIVDTEPISAQHIKPFVFGDDVRKYQVNYKEQYLIRIPKGWTNEQMTRSANGWNWFSSNFPVLAQHLFQFKSDAERRQDQGDYWWELRACDYYDRIESPKICYPDIAKESRVAFDSKGTYCSNTVYFIPRDDMYLLGLLNSNLVFQYCKRIASVLGDPDKGGRLRWFRQDVLRLPIRAIAFTDPAEKSQHDKIVALVVSTLELHDRLGKASTPHEKEFLERQILVTDVAIDSLVYGLYGLTQDEISIVEGKK